MINRYLEGGLTDAELGEFLRLMDSSRRELDSAALQVLIDRLIGESLRNPLDSDRVMRAVGTGHGSGRFANGVMRRLAARKEGPGSRPARGRWLKFSAVAAAAAVLLAVIGAYLFYSGSQARAASLRAQITALSGEVSTVRGERELPLKQGATIRPGQTVKTTAGSRAALRYPDGSTVKMNSGTSLRLARVSGGKALVLEAGAIYVDARPQPAHSPMVINPGRADRAEIVGTELEMIRGRDGTALRVRRGSVRFGSGPGAVLCRNLEASRVTGDSGPTPPQRMDESQFAVWRTDRRPAADSWYVRSYERGPYGAGDGSSYTNAWRSFADIVWGDGGVKPGDTLYVCGFHTGSRNHFLQVGTAGREGAPVIIDGGYPGDPGMIFGSYGAVDGPWSGPDEFGAWRCPNTGLNNGRAYEDPGGSGDPGKFRRLICRSGPPDKTWKPGSAWVIHDIKAGRKMIYYKPNSGRPRENTFYCESGGGILIKDRDHVTVRNLRVWGSNSLIRVRNSDHVRIENCDLRWAAYVAVQIDHGSDHGTVRNCHIREVGSGIYARNAGNPDGDDGNDDWYVGHNHIHHLSDGLAYGAEGDHHAIGWQNGDRVIVEHNHVHDGGGPMICFWIGANGHQRDNVIRYNFVHDNPRYGEADNHWSKSGISLASDNLARGERWTGNLVHHNIVARVGSRAIYTKTHSNTLGLPTSGIYHNVVLGTYAHWKSGKGNAYEAGGKAAYRMKNNVALDSALYQFFQNPALPNEVPYDRADITIDRNLYWTGAVAGKNSFSWDGSVFETLAGWQAGSRGLGFAQDATSMKASPLYQNRSGSFSKPADFSPSWNSPLIDAGTAETPGLRVTGDILGNPIYGTPDIGAVEYQPPYMMGTDPVDVAANVRVYADGKFRNTARPSGRTAKLSVQPAGGYPAEERGHWLDLVIMRWETRPGEGMKWRADFRRAGRIVWKTGGLNPDSKVRVYLTPPSGTRVPVKGRLQTDKHGTVTFECENVHGKTLYEIEPQ